MPGVPDTPENGWGNEPGSCWLAGEKKDHSPIGASGLIGIREGSLQGELGVLDAALNIQFQIGGGEFGVLGRHR